MRKAALVARHEFISTLKRRSALFVLFGLPLLSLLFLTALDWFVGPAALDETDVPAAVRTGRNAINTFIFGEGSQHRLPLGLVDDTGHIQHYPAAAALIFTPLASLEAAHTAYEAGQIRAYFHIPAGYLAAGQLFYYAGTFTFNTWERQSLYELLLINFLDDTLPLDRLAAPTQNLRVIHLGDDRQQEEPPVAAGFLLGIGIAILFYLTAMGASGYLLQGLGQEKQNRVMEVLLSSLRPLELLLGKIIGLGAVGLLQMAVWSAIALLIFRRGDTLLRNITLPALTVETWGLIILHFLAGYLLYASLFAGLGAVMPGPKESSQYTFLIMLPTFLPLWFSTVILTAPNGALATTLSLIPLTAPITMPMRLTITAVPTTHWLLSLSATLLTALLILWLVSKLFHSRLLLTGQPLTPRTLYRALR